MGKNFRETLSQQMEDPEFKREWDALEPEFRVIRAQLEDKKILSPSRLQQVAML